jgi:DNA polymerase III delta prime subunit
MPVKKEQLFEAFGEILYALAAVDGKIQQEEKVLIAQAIKHHRYEYDILFSFKQEVTHARTITEAFTKAMQTFRAYGPFDGYSDFKIILENLAESFQGISTEEQHIIDKFHKELLANFKI